MGQTSSQPATPSQTAPPSGCPLHAQSVPAAPAQCPVAHSPPAAPSVQAVDVHRPAQCPINRGAGELNPLNQMPVLPQALAPGQAAALPLERTASSIPRGGGEVWEYPSPQQFHNALLRKGMETPEEHVDMMVQIHNFLNERAWDEVLRWERRRDSSAAIELARFRGRPGELSPKARFWLFAGWLLPTRFNSDPPFDRHDWIVRRRATGEEVRYVIDYYSAPPDEDGSPVFSLDVRPALDNLGSVRNRISIATEEAWTSWKDSQGERGQGRAGSQT